MQNHPLFRALKQGFKGGVMERNEFIIKINDADDEAPGQKPVDLIEKNTQPGRSRWKRIAISGSFSSFLLVCFFALLSKAEDAGFVETRLNLSWFKSDAADFDNKRVAIEQPLVIKQRNESKPSADPVNARDSAEKAKGSACISWDVEKC